MNGDTLLLCAEKSRIELRVVSYLHQRPYSVDDANWLQCEVQFEAADFSVRKALLLRTQDFQSLLDGVKSKDEIVWLSALEGEFEFKLLRAEDDSVSCCGMCCSDADHLFQLMFSFGLNTSWSIIEEQLKDITLYYPIITTCDN